MKQTILYDEGYEYDIKVNQNDFSIHFDYGTRYNQINMQFAHFHSFYEIYVLLNGDSQHFVEGRSFNLETYDFVLLKPYRLHRTNYFEHQPCKRLIIQFSLDFFRIPLSRAINEIEGLFDAEEPVYRFSENQNIQLISLYNQMYMASTRIAPTADFLITGLFLQLMDFIYDNRQDNRYSPDRPGSLRGSSNPMESKVYEITSYIHSNYRENITLDNLANRFFISPHYLSRQFRKVTGFTLIKYIQETRIKRAQELLLDTDMKIIDIISQCGFGSISQFNRVFNSLAGCSPSMYRKEHRL